MKEFTYFVILLHLMVSINTDDNPDNPYPDGNPGNLTKSSDQYRVIRFK